MARVLIAEDDQLIRKMVGEVATKMGHIVFMSPNGKHAYETLKSNEKFDLLIADIMMPEMDGKQLIQTIRGDSEFKDIPILIISAVMKVTEAKGLLKLGATIFQPKPLSIERLQENIDECLRGIA